MTKTLFYHLIVTGCQMNKSDAERVAAVLEHLNYQATVDVEKADLAVFVACSVRQKAIDRIWGFVRNAEQRKVKHRLVTILTGCLLTKDKEALSERFDFVFDIKDLASFEKFLHQRQTLSKDYLEILPKCSTNYQAYVPIMTGCNNFCSYCAVPYTRGREVSRNVKSILREVRGLANRGYLEITLLGQNVNSFAPKDAGSFNKKNPFKHNFARLLWEINQIKGIKRVNFVAAHPKDMADEVISALALPKMMNYLHLAVQSGDDEILKKMNRHYTAQDYLEIIEKVRQVKPNIAIGTDIIVGFPGETKAQFANTLKLYRKAKFDITYQAMYSPRPGTEAAKLVDNVDLVEKKRRWRAIQNLMVKTTLGLNKKFVQREVSVLVDMCSKGFCEGNSSEMKRVRFRGSKSLLGQIVPVIVTKAQTWRLSGKIKAN